MSESQREELDGETLRRTWRRYTTDPVLHELVTRLKLADGPMEILRILTAAGLLMGSHTDEALAEQFRRGWEAGRADLWLFCPECGPNVAADEDGCCVTCGATVTGSWLEREREREREAHAFVERGGDEAGNLGVTADVAACLRVS